MEQSDIDFLAEIVSKENESINEKFDNLEKRFYNIDEMVKGLNLEVRILDSSLDREIRPIVKIIAEGHSNFSRRLGEYIRCVSNVENEQMQLQLQMIYLESELKKIKERLGTIT